MIANNELEICIDHLWDYMSVLGWIANDVS